MAEIEAEEAAAEAARVSPVIPGRAEGANPESMIPAFPITETGVMDSGSRFARPE
jgi:hypothetical protein